MKTIPKLGFALLSHKPPDAHFLRLLDYLAKIPNAQIGLHHDFSQSSFPQQIVEKYGIHIVQPSRKTKWGHASKVPATLDIFRLLQKTDPKIDWYITVSPNCYPLVSRTKLLKFHEEASADVMMDIHRVHRNADPWLKVKYRFIFSRHFCSVPWISRKGKFYFRKIRFPIRRSRTPFAKIDPWQGSDWFTLSRKAMDRVLDAKLENDPVFLYLAEINKLKYTHVSPIEMVLQTFLAHQKDLLIDYSNYRFIDWENSKNWHPNTLTMEHWNAIQNSKALFARKFHPMESSSLLTRIDRYLLDLG